MSLYDDVIGQPAAVARLRAAAAAPVHAYLFVGPPGTGKRTAARSFGAALLCPSGGDGTCETCRRALAGTHPDVRVVERTGPAITVDEAREIARLAARTPVEADRKVLILTDFHLVEEAAPALLKTIEEPPASTVFVILANLVPPELVTIASRSARVDFGPVPPELLERSLVESGVAPEQAAEVAVASAGRLDRARLLAADPEFAARRRAWQGIPARLDGTGAATAVLTTDLLSSLEAVLAPLRERQAAEVAVLDERARLQGERGAGRRDLETRHRREQRRLRLDELRFGLVTLAGVYRDRLAGGASGPAARAGLAALTAIGEANEALLRNPNESLLLQSLLVRLSGLAG